MRLRTSVVAIIAIALIMTGGWALSQTRADSRAPFAQAMDTAPAATRIAGFTDWAGIRTTLGIGAVRTAAARDNLVGGAFKRNLSVRSMMESFTEEMHSSYGWSVADLRWEMLSQASAGAVLSAGLDEDLKSSTITGGLTKLGYAEKDGIWANTVDALSAALPDLPSTFVFAAYFPRERLIYFSDGRAYLQKVVDLHRAHGATLAGVRAARTTAAPLTGALSAVITRGADSCQGTSVTDQPADVRAQARNIVEPLGKLSSYRYAGRALFDEADDRHLTFSMTFDTGAAATSQLDLRRQLTKGPFLGHTGRLQDVLKLRSTRTDGPTASFDFGFDPDKASFMNGQGPLLFATCEV